MRKKFLTVFILVWLAAVPSLAAVIDAGAWAELYSYKIKLPQTQSQLRSLEGLRLGVRDAFIPGLSLFVRGRVASDLQHKFASDPDLRVFGAYLEYSRARWITARAGRQFVSAGVGALTLDGVKIDLSHRGGLTLTGYAGTTPGLTFYDLDEVNSWNKGNAYGGRLKFGGLTHWVFGASFQQRNYLKNLDSQIGGLDLAYSENHCGLFGRGDYDFFFKKLRLLTIRPTLRSPEGHSVSFEYLYRGTYLPLHNMFSVFKSKPFNQYRLSPTLKVGPNTYVLTSFAYTDYISDQNFRMSLGASYKGQSAGFIYADGYGGYQYGAFGSFSCNVNKSLQVYLHGDMFNYMIDPLEDDYTPSLAGALGTYFTIVNGLQTRAEVQLLSNRDYKYDSRFYLRLEYFFRKTISESIGGDGR